MSIHKALMDASGTLIQTLLPGNSSEAPNTNSTLVDALTCLFRMRYRNSNVPAADLCVPATVLAVKHNMLVLWCTEIGRCVTVTDNANENAFHLQLAVHASATVGRICQSVGIASDALAQAVAAYAERGTSDGVAAAADAIREQAQRALDADAAQLTPCDPGHIAVIQYEVITLLVGSVIGLYETDVEALGAKVLACTSAAVQGDDREELAALRIAHDAFVRDMLGFLDGLRFEEKFQYVFCLWGPAPSGAKTVHIE
jgi:hypothetical protein